MSGPWEQWRWVHLLVPPADGVHGYRIHKSIVDKDHSLSDHVYRGALGAEVVRQNFGDVEVRKSVQAEVVRRICGDLSVPVHMMAGECPHTVEEDHSQDAFAQRGLLKVAFLVDSGQSSPDNVKYSHGTQPN